MIVKKFLAAAFTALAAAFAFAGTASAQDNESTWDRIKRTGEVRFRRIQLRAVFREKQGYWSLRRRACRYGE